MGEGMKKLLAIGEALIDFIPMQTGVELKEVECFRPVVGGAPANVCGAFSRLGGKSAIITQLGEDAFGDRIVDELGRFGIDTGYVKRTRAANTCLAFVSLKENGERDFAFYRNPSADMLLEPSDVRPAFFADAFCLHFCSVSLGEFPMKQAHERAVALARRAGAAISFDPNLRFPLWEDRAKLKRAVWEFIPKADILKISDEELPFLTGKERIADALPQLFAGSVELVVYTKGPDGAEAYTKKAAAEAAGVKVAATDTTGAGDAFIGSFLYQLYDMGMGLADLPGLTSEVMGRMLRRSNLYCSRSVQQSGAIPSYPTRLDE